MKNTMCGLTVILLTIMGFATARSLPMTSNQQTTGEIGRLGRRETDSTNQMDSADQNLNEFMAELANLSIPSYLKDLFINLTLSNETGGLSDDAKVNTIRSYENQIKNIGCGHYKFHMKKHELDGEDVIRAELRLLQKSSTTLDNHYDVEIYSMLHKKTHESPLQLSFKTIDSTPGWKTFDITPLVLKWKQGSPNHGLQIKLTKDGKMLSCKGVFTEEQDSQEQPSLVVFTHDHSPDSFINKIKKEKASHTVTHQKRRTRNSDNSDATNVSATTIPIVNAKCHLKQMTVQSEHLSTGSMHVLLPKQLDAGICDGHCTKFDPESLQRNTITSHADVLSLYYHNTAGIQEAPSRCCKATSFETVHMAFYDETAMESIIKTTVPAKATACSCL